MADETKPEPEKPAAVDPLVWIEVLETRTKIGSGIYAKGHKERIPLSKAKVLAELGKITITGA